VPNEMQNQSIAEYLNHNAPHITNNKQNGLRAVMNRKLKTMSTDFVQDFTNQHANAILFVLIWNQTSVKWKNLGPEVVPEEQI
jgi:hypothetical protein